MTARKPKIVAEEVLAFVKGYAEEHGAGPSLREVMERFGFASTNGARYWLRYAVAQGWLTIRAGVARGMMLTQTGRERVNRWKADRIEARGPLV